MALSKTTRDHDEIQQWAEKRGAKPAEVASTEQGGKAGIIRLEFPGAPHANDSALKEISWDEWFEKFDASGLELVYQEVTAEGAESNFNRLIYPENESPSAKKSAAKKTASKKSTPAKTAAKKSPAKAPAKKAPAKGQGTRKEGPNKDCGSRKGQKGSRKRPLSVRGSQEVLR